MNSEINYKIIQKQVTLLSRDTFLFSAMLQEILKSKNQRKICIFVLSTIISKIYYKDYIFYKANTTYNYALQEIRS